MSVDPDPPSSSDPTPPKTSADPSGESAESLHLKRRFKKGGGAESEEDEKPDQTIQLLSTLLQDLIAKKDLPSAAESEPKPTKYHRLSKTGSGVPAGMTEGATPGSSAPAGSGAETVPAPGVEPAPAAAPPVAFRAAPVFESAAAVRRRRRLHVLYILGALTLAVAAYYAGSHDGVPDRRPGSPNKPPPLTTSAWTEATLNQLDQALAADQAGDLRGARRIASAIKKPDMSPPPGLDLYLDSLATRQEHTYDVEADLLRAVGSASPGEAAAINERLAFNFSRARDFENAAIYYKAASQADPFPAPLFYHWGETLRHLGRFQEADAIFRRALERVPTGQPETGSLRECITLKQRLALVEQGRDGEFQAEMAGQLKASLPSGYWLLTAAAVALQHNNLPEAAGFLGRARDALGTAQFDSLLNDYFFRAFADRKELADFFPPDPAARHAVLQPTMTYSVEP